MRNAIRQISLAFAVLLTAGLIVCNASAQDTYLNATGSPTFNTQYPIPSGFVDIGNGDLHLDFPLGAGGYKTRGALPAVGQVLNYDSRIWKVNLAQGGEAWAPNNAPIGFGGWQLAGQTLNPDYESYDTVPVSCGLQYRYFVAYDASLNARTFPITTTHATQGNQSNCTDTSYGSAYATDGSGYYAVVLGYTSIYVFDNAGNMVYPEVIDRNGNTQTLGGDGNIVDSRGIEQMQTSTANNNQFIFNVIAPGGARLAYTATVEEIAVSTNFKESGVTEWSGVIPVIQSLQLPDGTSYSFTYDSGTSPGHYGELTGMTLPTGANVTFGYGPFTDTFGNINHWLTSATQPNLTQYNQQFSETTTFTPKTLTTCTNVFDLVRNAACTEQVTVAKPNGDNVIYQQVLNNGAWNSQTQYIPANTSSSILTTNTSYNFATECDQNTCTGSKWVHSASSTTTVPGTNATMTSATETDYSAPETGQPSALKEWDYYSGQQPSTPTRQRNYTYAYNSGLLSNTPLVTEVDQLDAAGRPFAKTTYGYDEYPLAPPSGSTSSTEIVSTPGNLTSENHVTDLTSGSAVSTHYHYDQAGSVASFTDGNNNVTAYAHDSPTDTFVTQTTYPTTAAGVTLTTSATYDQSTGFLMTTTDENGQTTTNAYDSLARLQSVTNPDGGTATYSYPSSVETDIATAIDPATTMTTKKIVDQLNRPSQTITTSANGPVTTTTYYDENGNLSLITGPSGTNPSATDQSTAFNYDVLGRLTFKGVYTGTGPNTANTAYQSATYDGVNKIVGSSTASIQGVAADTKTYTYDAFKDLKTVLEYPQGINNGGPAYDTNYVYDPTGHLTAVFQSEGTASTEQWRIRVFEYDAAGRRTSETTPESGTTSYVPDGNGNVTSSTDARGITVTSLYDTLNRLTSTSSSDGSVSETFTYDEANHGFSKGHLTTASSGSKQAGYQLSYDAMGRIAGENYCLPSTCYGSQVSATFDYLGEMSSLTYPDGRIVTWSHDTGDHISAITNMQSNGAAAQFSYLSGTSYAPPGQLIGATYGNGVQLAKPFNGMQEPSSLTYTTSTGATLWSSSYLFEPDGFSLMQITNNLTGYARQFTYDYADRVASATDVAMNVPGGTPATGTVTITGQEQSATQCTDGTKDCVNPTVEYETGTVTLQIGNSESYTVKYGEGSTPDTLAQALAFYVYNNSYSQVTAQANGATVTLTSKQQGPNANLTLSTSTTFDLTSPTNYFDMTAFQSSASGLSGGGGTVPSNLFSEQYTYDLWGNLQQSGSFTFSDMSDNNNHLLDQNVSYDPAGDMLKDQLGNNYTYDGLRRLSSGNGSTYTYDPSGERIRKDGSGATEYVRFNGVLLSERSPGASTWTDYVYNGNALLAEVPGTQPNTPLYHLNDHLGSLIGLVDANQNFTGPNDFAPYGESIAANAANSFLFTGLEHDAETGTDHAEFRQFTSTQGRWLEPDPSDSSYDLYNPASLNRYGYINGKTESFTDPTGLDGGSGDGVLFDIALSAILDISQFLGNPPSINLQRLVRRPNSAAADPLSESLGIPSNGPPLRNPGLAGALGLPTPNGCEFGACGVGSDFQDNPAGVPSNIGISIPAEVWLWATTGKHSPLNRFSYNYGNWCGSGGSGAPINDVDAHCLLHDYCYAQNGNLSSRNNYGPANGALQACNQALCDGVEAALPTSTPFESIEVGLIVGYFKEFVGAADAPNGCRSR